MPTLQEMREDAGMITPEEFAAAAGISLVTLQRAERGVRVSRNTALHIARALGKKLKELPIDYTGKKSSGDANAQ